MRIDWWNIHRVARAIGYPFRAVFERLGVWFMPDFEDEADFWSGFHALAGALIANIAVGYGGFHWRSLLEAFTASFLWMLAYELLIDGLRIEDVRGAQQSDIGYNFIGAFLSIISLALGHLLRAV